VKPWPLKNKQDKGTVFKRKGKTDDAADAAENAAAAFSAGDAVPDGEATEPEAAGAGNNSDPAVTLPSESEIAALARERDRQAEEIARLRDQLLRKQAEFDNFRKRSERERREVLEYASLEAVREMLPVLDSVERALNSDPDAIGEFRFGIELIAQKFWDTLSRFGLRPIPAKGEKFDPHRHQAVEKVESNDHEDETVLEEWQRGYMFKDKLLRPAMVKVAVLPAKAPSRAESE